MPDSAELEQKIIDAIYRGACDPEELERAIDLIGQYFDSPGVSLGEFDQVNPEAQFAVGIGITDAAFLRSYARYADLDPAPMKFAALQTGTATTTDRMFSAEFLRTSVFLNEFFRPYGIEWNLGRRCCRRPVASPSLACIRAGTGIFRRRSRHSSRTAYPASCRAHCKFAVFFCKARCAMSC